LHIDLIGAVGGIGYRMACRVPTAVTVILTAAMFWSDRRPGNAMAGAAQLDQLRPAMAYITASLGKHRLLEWVEISTQLQNMT
jgi:hypothetical protein